MPKTLLLKPRIKRGKSHAWHDSFVLQTALDRIATGKPLSKIGIWLSIAGKIQFAQEDEELGPDSIDNVISIKLRNVESRMLCKELRKLTPEQFGQDASGRPLTPPLGTLNNMLVDIGTQLGKVIIVVDEGDDDEDDEDDDAS